jgi:hypothetical protein
MVGTYNRKTGGQLWVSEGGDDEPLADWVKIAPDGFGDPSQVAVASLILFQGHLYAGTSGDWLGTSACQPAQLWRTRCPVDQSGEGCLASLFE